MDNWATKQSARTERRLNRTSAGIGTRRAGLTDLLAKVVLLGTPIAYALGRIYSEGYWEALGVSPVAMSRGTEDYLYSSLVMVVNAVVLIFPSVSEPTFWIGVLAFAIILAALGALSWLSEMVGDRLRPKLRRAGRAVRIWSSNKRSLSTAGRLSGATTLAGLSLLYAGIFLSTCLLLPLIAAHQLGKSSAQRMHQSLTAEPLKFAMVEAGDEVRVRGRLIDCTDRRCVIHTGTEFLPVAAQSVRWLLSDETESMSAPNMSGISNESF